MYIMEPCEDTEVNSAKEIDPLSEPNILDLCRLCAHARNKFMPIFSDEGLTNDIPQKLEKYLPVIKVSDLPAEDEVPWIMQIK